MPTYYKNNEIPFLEEWLQFQTENILAPNLRDIVMQCWNEAKFVGLNGYEHPRLLYLTELQLESVTERSSQLIKVVTGKVKRLIEGLNEDLNFPLYLFNEQGILIHSYGLVSDDPQEPRPGLLAGFPFLGHTAISLTLKTKKIEYLIGAEHYFSLFHPYTSIAVPIFHPMNRECIGCLGVRVPATEPIYSLKAILISLAMAVEESISMEYSQANIFKIHEEITNLMDHYLIIVGSNGRIVDCNKAFKNLMSGIPVVGMMARDLFDHYYEHDFRSDALYRALFYNEETSNQEVWTKVNGQRYCFLVDTKIIHDPFDPGFFWVIEISKDITQKKEMDLTMVQREKMASLGTLAAGLAHEIRNPLTTAKGFIQFLSENSPDKDRFILVQNELNRITQLVNQFVLLSKPDSPQMKPISAYTLLEEFINFIKPEALLKGINIEYKPLHEDLLVRVDKNQLTQVFINLSQNAFCAMESGGTLRIEYRLCDNDAVEFHFIDDGIGISEEHLDKILDPFFTTREEGTGLGLPICYQIITAHHGELKILSEKHKGTTVIVRLPQQNNI